MKKDHSTIACHSGSDTPTDFQIAFPRGPLSKGLERLLCRLSKSHRMLKNLTCGQLLSLLEIIDLSDFTRIHAEFSGQFLHLGLVCETDLRGSKTPVRTCKCIIGQNRVTLNFDMRDPIRTSRID